MSYARFGWDGSDVYLFLDVSGYYNCCACSLGKDDKFYTTKDFIEHLKEHQKLGDVVPSDSFERLIEEAEENDAWIKEKQETK